MSKRLRIAVVTVVSTMLAALPVAASASSAVLTSGAADIDPGAQLEAPAAGNVTFASGASGGGAVTCSASDIAATVQTNPAAPGTATLSVTGLSFSGCSTTIADTTGVDRVAFDHLPYAMSISDATSPPTATLRPGGDGPIQVALRLDTPSGPIHCIYRPRDSSISTSLTAGGVAFDVALDPAEVTDISTEPCLHSLHFSGSYGPFFDLGSLEPVVVS